MQDLLLALGILLRAPDVTVALLLAPLGLRGRALPPLRLALRLQARQLRLRLVLRGAALIQGFQGFLGFYSKKPRRCASLFASRLASFASALSCAAQRSLMCLRVSQGLEKENPAAAPRSSPPGSPASPPPCPARRGAYLGFLGFLRVSMQKTRCCASLFASRLASFAPALSCAARHPCGSGAPQARVLEPLVPRLLVQYQGSIHPEKHNTMHNKARTTAFHGNGKHHAGDQHDHAALRMYCATTAKSKVVDLDPAWGLPAWPCAGPQTG